MTTRFATAITPRADLTPSSTTRHGPVGFALAAIGLLLAAVTLVANITAATASSSTDAASTLAWSFGLTTTAFATIKLGVAVVLIGILIRLSLRIDGVRLALPRLAARVPSDSPAGREQPALSATAATSTTAPPPLRLNRMARIMWAPMLLMGAMAVLAGLVGSFVWAGRVESSGGATAGAWTQGLQFLGEGFLLSAIGFLLASILGSLREGGGRVQEALGLRVTAMATPWTARVFIGLMAAGLMVSIAQFVLYLVAVGVAGTAGSFAAWQAWLGPLREAGLGLILAGIVFALVTVGSALRFQFERLRTIVTTGR